jgi:hypothetical protein
MRGKSKEPDHDDDTGSVELIDHRTLNVEAIFWHSQMLQSRV